MTEVSTYEQLSKDEKMIHVPLMKHDLGGEPRR